MRTLRTAAGVALALAATLLPAALSAQEPLELKLRAAFLYNFARLTTWPADRFASPAAPLEACVPERAAIAHALEEAFAGKIIDGRPLVVRRLPGASGWDACHIAYLGPGLPDLAREVLGAAAARGVLTVHEDGAALPDGVIRLFVAENKLRFEVNATAAERARLRLNARLMALAAIVRVP